MGFNPFEIENYSTTWKDRIRDHAFAQKLTRKLIKEHAKMKYEEIPSIEET